MGKQMEGDNQERRKKAREARRRGEEPGEANVTSGASKQREKVPNAGDHEEKIDTLRQGKQGGGVQKHLPESRPRQVFGGGDDEPDEAEENEGRESA